MGIAVGATVGLLLIVFAVLFILNKKGVINIAFLNKLMKKTNHFKRGNCGKRTFVKQL